MRSQKDALVHSECSHSANAIVRASLWEPKFRGEERQRHKWKYQIRRSEKNGDRYLEALQTSKTKTEKWKETTTVLLSQRVLCLAAAPLRVMRWRPLRNDVHRADLMQTTEVDEEAVVIRSNHQIANRGREQDNRSSTNRQCNRVGAIYRQVPLSLSFCGH